MMRRRATASRFADGDHRWSQRPELKIITIPVNSRLLSEQRINFTILPHLAFADATGGMPLPVTGALYFAKPNTSRISATP